ncbi:MAG: hypothetical protein B7Y02_15875 [Rhodobacterales bacterium 17-64-5]|nr:MAG: hypothetical protein B7Y02_15875 [Rhodobacterales bacterium 17-64-5]
MQQPIFKHGERQQPLVSAVNRPQLRINLDLYHTQIGEGDLMGLHAAGEGFHRGFCFGGVDL